LTVDDIEQIYEDNLGESELPYVVTFNANGGTVFPANRRVGYGEMTRLPVSPIRRGHVFDGWNTESDGSGNTFSNETIVTENIAVYAQWKMDSRTYTITFDANGGINAPDSQIKNHDLTLILSNVQPTREGHRFLGWTTESIFNSSLPLFPFGGEFTINSDTTLYAVWWANSYAITFSANGDNAGSVPIAQSKIHDIPLILSAVIPTRTGHTFLGWSDIATATVPENPAIPNYHPGSTFNGNATTTLYAIWNPLEYTVTFDANDGIDAPDSQRKFHGINLTLSNVHPAREGYAFLGWSTNRNARTATHHPGSNFTANAATVFYAVWAEIVGNLNINATIPIDITSGGQVVVYEFTPATTGNFAFMSSCNNNRVIVGSVYNASGIRLATNTGNNGMFLIDYTYTAGNTYYLAVRYSDVATTGAFLITIRINYTISYNMNGGSGSISNQIKTHDLALTLSNTRPTRSGQTFLGWSTDRTATVATYQPSDRFLENANTTLFAVWGVGYAVTYNANGGSNAPIAQIKQHDVPLTLRTGEPTRSGHTFLGWATTNNATVSEYQPGGSFNRNATTTLFAVWGAYTYTVAFDANGGDGAPESQIKTHGVTLVLSNTQPTREGHNFRGWSTNRNATSASHQPGGNFTGNTGTTFFAVWQAHTYTITYNANGGSGAPSSQTKTHGVDLTLRTNRPTRTGHAFSGWATNSTATSAEYQPGDILTINAVATLFAVWEIVTAPTITTTTLPVGMVGTAYSAALVGTGGNITWSIANGTLPVGLSLASSTGVISGRPTAVGTFNFTVRARNSVNPEATRALSITISVAPNCSECRNDPCICNPVFPCQCGNCRGWGDVDGDGVITSADVTLLRRFIAANDKDDFIANNPSFNLANANVDGSIGNGTNGDGIDSADVTLLRRWIAASTKFPLGPQTGP
jgi:uncharacterized repeat protein (TIGR02543 family)